MTEEFPLRVHSRRCRPRSSKRCSWSKHTGIPPVRTSIATPSLHNRHARMMQSRTGLHRLANRERTEGLTDLRLQSESYRSAVPSWLLFYNAIDALSTKLGRLPYGFALHERERVAGELFFALVHAAPDLGGGGEFGQGEAEGFDDHPAVVAGFL